MDLTGYDKAKQQVTNYEISQTMYQVQLLRCMEHYEPDCYHLQHQMCLMLRAISNTVEVSGVHYGTINIHVHVKLGTAFCDFPTP